MTHVLTVLACLDTVDNSKTAIVTFLPLAKTNDPNECFIVKDQYNQWLTVHKLLPTPGRVKDYSGVTWIDAVSEMAKRIKSSKNELQKLI